MGYLIRALLVLTVSISLSFCDDCTRRLFSAAGKGQCLEETHQDGKHDKFVESKQENENVLLKNDHIVESSSKPPPVDEVIESIGNSEVYEGWRATQQYEGAGYGTRSPLSGEEGTGVYEEPVSEMGEVLVSDHKEERKTLTDQSKNKNDSDINSSENKDISFTTFVESQPPNRLDIENSNVDLKSLQSDNTIEDITKTYVDDSLNTNPLEENLDTPRQLSEVNSIKAVSSPQKLTMEETIGDVWREGIQNEKDGTLLSFPLNENVRPMSRKYYLHEYPVASKLTMEESTETKNEKELAMMDMVSIKGLYETEKNHQQEILTTDTTSTYSATEQDVMKEESLSGQDQNTLENINQKKVTADIDLSGHYSTEGAEVATTSQLGYESTTSINSSSNKTQDTILSSENLPVAERFYSFNIEKDDVENNLNNRYNPNRDTESGTSGSQSLRDYEDKSEEDKVVIKSLLSDYPSFKKEKIEPGVLFEDCPDCDFRVLPIRPSEQRKVPNEEEETLPTQKIRFSELPEGRELQIYTLDLSDGIFLFSYLSEFLSWIQPNEFPVELLRDALRSQISWIGLITQSLQVEAGFVACLVMGVLLALAVPVVVLSHACYKMRGRDEDQSQHAAGWVGNCQRRTLVFILQVLLVLLFAGMVAMFVTNEQLSGAVVQSSDVLQTSLSDISAFVHNSHLQLHFLVTQSMDQALQAIYADLDNVDSLLGRPIQQELIRETGLDVALDSLSDLTREAKETTQQVERFLDEARIVQEMVVSSREKLLDLRQQVELFRRACGPRDRTMCDTIDATGMDITLRLDKIKSDERLNRMRRMGGIGLEAAALEAKEHFMSVPNRVETDTKDARETVRRQLSRQRAEIDDKSMELGQLARGMTSKVNEAKYQAGFWMQDIDQFEYWRWIICLGGGAAVLMIWTMLLCSMCCGCCGSEKAAGPTILVTIVLVCLFSTVLWTMTLVGMVVGGHGEVFVCRPLYDEPDYHVISHLVDEPGVFYNQPHGGFIANVIYGNDSLDVPIKQVLQDCHENRAIYPTLGLHRVFDVEGAVDKHRWGSVSTHLRGIRANLSSLQVLSPALQDHLADLLITLSVNFTEHRIQMSKPVTSKDLDSFARQLDNIGNQLRDLATASRLETLSSRTRRLIDSHIRPLEGRKDALVFQLTALEVQTGPLQRQVNQSLSHLKTIQFFINSQGESIAHRKSRQYVDRLLSYVDQLRQHVENTARNSVSPCRPLWDIFNSTRLFLCRHTMDPLNGYWFATMWCLIVLLIATPVCLKLVDYYRAQGSRPSGSPTENLMISEQGTGWSSPGYDIKSSKGYSDDYK